MTSETEPASEEFLAKSRGGAGFEAVLANAALGGFGGLLPSAELGRLAKAMVHSPKPVARRVVDLAARLGEVGIGGPGAAGGAGWGRSASACRLSPARGTGASPTVRGRAIPSCGGSPSGTWPAAMLHRGSSRTLTWTGAPGGGSHRPSVTLQVGAGPR